MEYNLAEVLEAVEAVDPDRACIVTGDATVTYGEFGDATRRFANLLMADGFGTHTERADLANHESGQDHVALYLYNGPEYLEAMIGAYKARCAPFNVNYRYVADELRYLLTDARARVIVYHSAFAPTLAEVRDDIDGLDLLLQVRDDSGHELLPGARWYDEALAAQPATLADDVRSTWSPDDLYILYTGGTTGMPKGVLWRQADIFVGSLGGRNRDTGDEWPSLTAITDVAVGGAKLMPAPPFMHGAAHWLALTALTGGNTIVLPSDPRRFDPVDVLDTIAQKGVNIVLIVGDAFGRPLVEEIETGGYDLSSLLVLISGGAALSAPLKQRFLDAAPSAMILDGLGASETGTQASQLTAAGQTAQTGQFTPAAGMVVLDEDLAAVVNDPDVVGWLGQAQRVPLGYLGDPEKSARTFPDIDGVRYAVPGDRAHMTSDGMMVLLGRDSVTINSGGEKIFAEEVEAALAAHPDVFDAVVCGRPSERWGQEVVAIVQLRDGAGEDTASLDATVEQHLARYKVPKQYVFVEKVMRAPTGKADYRWAKARALDEA